MRQSAGLTRTVVLAFAVAAALALGASSTQAQAARFRTAAEVSLIVKFTRGSTQVERRALLVRHGAHAVRQIAQLRIAVVRAAPAAAAALAAEPGVAYAERDHLAYAVTALNDPYYNPSASPCTSSLGCWPYANIHLPEAWNASTGSSSVVVAVVDSGVDATNPDLAGAVLPGWNVIAGNSNAADDFGHGTEVAGVIAARSNNGIGVPGVCGQCKILPVKAIGSNGSGTTSNIALGVTWAADHGARVINLSVGSNFPDPAMRDAISYAIGKGALVVAAAGNAGSSDPTVCANGACGGYPAAFTTQIPSGLISVGATDYFNHLYAFSNHGSWVTVAAPGCSVAVKMGGTFDSTGACGTSIASPFVAGLAALAFSVAPQLTPAAAQSAIAATSARVAIDVANGLVNAATLLQSLGLSTSGLPVKTADPVISGDARDGSLLTVSQGSWSGATSFAYAWVRCDRLGNACSTAGSGTSYALTVADVGHTVKATVTATNAVGSTAAFALSPVVAAQAPANTVAPAIAGKALFGATLATSTGTWSGSAPLSYAYQWQSSADGVTWTSAGGINATYVAGPAVSGRALRVAVTATNAAGSATAYSPATDSIAAPPTNTAWPRLSTAIVRVGATLQATTPGVWSASPAPTFTYQWQYSATCASWSNVAGANAADYVVTRAVVNDCLRVVATARNSVGAASAASGSTARVLAPPALVAAPLLTAILPLRAGTLITAATGTWSASPAPFYTFAWQVSADGVHWTTIAGAVSSRFTATAWYVGKAIRVTVTATNALGSTSATSAAVGKTP